MPPWSRLLRLEKRPVETDVIKYQPLRTEPLLCSTGGCFTHVSSAIVVLKQFDDALCKFLAIKVDDQPGHAVLHDL
jgi:hypothetical protein